jgi:hypothetical protein
MKEKIKIRRHTFSPDELLVETGKGRILLTLHASTVILLGDYLEDLLTAWARDAKQDEAMSMTIHGRGFAAALSRGKTEEDGWTPPPEFIISNRTGRVSLDVWGARRLFQRIRSY